MQMNLKAGTNEQIKSVQLKGLRKTRIRLFDVKTQN